MVGQKFVVPGDVVVVDSQSPNVLVDMVVIEASSDCRVDKSMLSGNDFNDQRQVTSDPL